MYGTEAFSGVRYSIEGGGCYGFCFWKYGGFGMTEYKNNESYPDPTAYQAIKNIERENKLKKRKKKKMKRKGVKRNETI